MGHSMGTEGQIITAPGFTARTTVKLPATTTKQEQDCPTNTRTPLWDGEGGTGQFLERKQELNEDIRNSEVR